MASTSTLCEVISECCQGRLGTGLHDTLDIVCKRLAVEEMATETRTEALEFVGSESCLEVLEADDHKVIADMKKKATTGKAVYDEIVQEVKQRRQRLLELAGEAGAAGKRRGRAAAKKLAATIEHATAKQFVPFGASVWRGLIRGEWCGHYPPFKRISAPWAFYGERGAMFDVLRGLWQQHCAYKGLSYPADVPHKLLFEEE